MATSIIRISLFGWENCYQLTSGDYEIVITADIGPRIIFFGEKDGKNLLSIAEEQAGRTGDEHWLVYGGHRVWAAPEDPKISYLPDNEAVRVEMGEDQAWIKLTRPADGSNLQKSIEMRVATMGGFVIRNEIVNTGTEEVLTASWGITAFAPGGLGIMPLSRNTEENKRLQADLSINIWNYTDLSDPAFIWKEDALLIDQKACLAPQKIGRWMQIPRLAYLLDEYLIIKESYGIQVQPENYPDQGSNVEIYFNPNLLELELLSPWKNLKPGEAVWHEETLSVKKIDDSSDLETVIEIVTNNEG